MAPPNSWNLVYSSANVLANNYSFTQQYQQLTSYIGARDAYFFYKRFKIFVSSVGLDFFNHPNCFSLLDKDTIIFTFIFDFQAQGQYTYWSSAYKNKNIIFLPFNWYTTNAIFSENAGFVRASNNIFYQIASVGHLPISYNNEVSNTFQTYEDSLPTILEGPDGSMNFKFAPNGDPLDNVVFDIVFPNFFDILFVYVIRACTVEISYIDAVSTLTSNTPYKLVAGLNSINLGRIIIPNPIIGDVSASISLIPGKVSLIDGEIVYDANAVGYLTTPIAGYLLPDDVVQIGINQDESEAEDYYYCDVFFDNIHFNASYVEAVSLPLYFYQITGHRVWVNVYNKFPSPDPIDPTLLLTFFSGDSSNLFQLTFSDPFVDAILTGYGTLTGTNTLTDTITTDLSVPNTEYDFFMISQYTSDADVAESNYTNIAQNFTFANSTFMYTDTQYLNYPNDQAVVLKYSDPSLTFKFTDYAEYANQYDLLSANYLTKTVMPAFSMLDLSQSMINGVRCFPEYLNMTDSYYRLRSLVSWSMLIVNIEWTLVDSDAIFYQSQTFDFPQTLPQINKCSAHVFFVTEQSQRNSFYPQENQCLLTSNVVKLSRLQQQPLFIQNNYYRDSLWYTFDKPKTFNLMCSSQPQQVFLLFA